jgi:probable selenium-dependent hydroxylase accessory protein YqeC
VESLSGWFEKTVFSTDGTPGILSGAAPVLTVIGSGGKTSLIWLLARSRRRRRILVSPSTKMLIPPPEADCYDRLIIDPAAAAALLSGPGEEGVTLAGTSGETKGKLAALSPGILAAAARGHDLTLIEGDGSRGLPLKAWAAGEPVVPPSTTATVGIMPLWPLGRPVSGSLIHRLPLFTALSGAAEGETLRPEHLVRIITGRPASRKTGGGEAAGKGLFARARGERILFFNQIDDGNLRQAEALAVLLLRESPPGLRWIIAGSAARDHAAVLAGA